MEIVDKEIEAEIKERLAEAEQSAKAVWEIDGITVYVRDILVNNNEITVDWFTFSEAVDKRELGDKVQDLAFKLIGGNKCSSNLFSRISSTMRNIFGSRGLT